MRFGLIGDVHAEDALLERTLDALRAERVDKILCTGDIVDGHGDVDRSCSLLREANALVVRGNHDRWIRADEQRTLPLATKMTDLSVETIAYLKTLPPTLVLDIVTGGKGGTVKLPKFRRGPTSSRAGDRTPAPQAAKLLLCHGVGSNDMCRLGPDDYGYAISSNDDLLAVLFDPAVQFMVGGHTHRSMVRKFERGSGKAPLVVVNPGTLAREHEPGFAILTLAPSRKVDFHRLGESGVTHVSCAPL